MIGVMTSSAARLKRQDIVCETSMEYVPYCTPCETSCEDKKRNKLCTMDCRFPQRCYCPSGYLYDAENKCIPAETCP